MNCKLLLRSTLVFSFLLISLFAFSQSTVSGKIIDQQTSQPLAGVTITVKGTKRSTTSSTDGGFTIGASSTERLVFSYVGFKTVELRAGNNMAITLEPDTRSMDAVVVIGYGTVKRRDLTGSVYSIKNEDIVRTPTHNAVEALQGRVPGVDITRSSGSAGAGVNVRVRGNRSVSGSNNPLFVIDGFQGGNVSDLNPNDIESIEVLKDAAATAIYGSQGANGVFIITTKKGTSGKTKVFYDGYYGVNGYTSYPKNRIGEDYIQMRREAFRNTTPQEWTSPADDYKLFPVAEEAAAVANGQWIDWFDLLNRNGQQQSHTVSVQSGSDKTKVFMSMGYFKEQGMLRLNDYTRFTFRLNVDQTLAKWAKVGMQSQIAYFTQNNRQDPLSLALQTSPLGKAYDSTGKINVFPVAGNATILSPLSDERGDTVAKNNVIRGNIMANVYLELTPVKGLTFRSSLGTVLNYGRQGIFQSASSVAQRNTRLVTASQGTGLTRAFNWDNTLTYAREFGKHNVSVTAIESYMQNDYDTLTGTGNRQLLASQLYYNLGATDPLTQRITSGYTGFNNLAFAGRINYSFDGKYLLAVTARADGASRLSPGNKWDYFPSVSAGWNLHEENFMKNINFLNSLKLRGSWGETGNYGISVYGTQSVIQAASNMGFGDVPVSYYNFSPRVGNPDLEWERSSTTNVGLDFGLFNNRLSGSVDWYRTETSKILFDRALPRSTGVSTVYQNIGATLNRGFEIAVTGRIIEKKDLSWDATATFTSNKEKITKLIDGKDIISGVTPEVLSLLLGRPINSFYSYRKLGIWQSDKASEAAAVRFGTTPFVPGDIRVQDLNGDSLIDTKDRQYLGAAVPKFVLGLQNNFSYKGIELSIYFFMRYGQMINAEYMGRYNPSGTGSGPANFDYWTPENPTNDFPRPKKGAQLINYAAYQSLNFVDGSYFKIKTVTLGYSIPAKVISRIKASNMRLYITGNNIFTKAKNHLLNDYDPERGGSESSPLSRQFVFGVNVGF